MPTPTPEVRLCRLRVPSYRVVSFRVSLLNKKKYRVAIAYATLFYGFPRPKDKANRTTVEQVYGVFFVFPVRAVRLVAPRCGSAWHIMSRSRFLGDLVGALHFRRSVPESEAHLRFLRFVDLFLLFVISYFCDRLRFSLLYSTSTYCRRTTDWSTHPTPYLKINTLAYCIQHLQVTTQYAQPQGIPLCPLEPTMCTLALLCPPPGNTPGAHCAQPHSQNKQSSIHSPAYSCSVPFCVLALILFPVPCLSASFRPGQH